MSTFIHFANCGRGKTVAWKFKAVSKKHRLLGQGLDSMGYWFPRPNQNNPRQIVLNRHRLRYWVRAGAQISPAVQRVMCIAGMMNAPWINFGRSFNYKTKTRAETIASHIRIAKAKDPSLMPEVYRLAREQEEENIMFRRIKEDKAALDLLLTRIDDEDVKPEEIFSEEETEFIRSKMFYRLKDMLEDIDNKVNFLNPATRKLIIHKMNRLSRVGILPKEETEKQFRAFKEEVTTIDSAKKALVLEKFGRSTDIMKEVEETFQTITKEEFIRLFQRYRPGQEAEHIEEIADDIYKELIESGAPVTRYLAMRILNEEEELKWGEHVPSQDLIL